MLQSRPAVSTIASACCRKGDLWAISSNQRLAAAGGPGSSDWVVVAQSCWHGPNADGRCALLQALSHSRNAVRIEML